MGVIGFLIAVNILLLIMGSFMEPSSIILITAPILFPIAMKLGIDPIHFGIMITVNISICPGPCWGAATCWPGAFPVVVWVPAGAPSCGGGVVWAKSTLI
jgi:hypothetical protein